MANKETVRVSPISEAIEKAKVPLSAAVKANGFVFVSGMPPIDRATGGMVRRANRGMPRERQSRARGRRIVARQGSEGDGLRRQRGALRDDQSRVRAVFSGRSARAHVRGCRLVADGVRHRDRVRRARLNQSRRRACLSTQRWNSRSIVAGSWMPPSGKPTWNVGTPVTSASRAASVTASRREKS